MRRVSVVTPSDASSVSTLILDSRAEHIITVHGRNIAALERSLRAEAALRNARILARVAFGGNRTAAALGSDVSSEEGCAVWLHGAAGGGPLAAVQAFALSGTQPVAVRCRGRCIGFVYEDEDARVCRLWGVQPENRQAAREAQARDVFEAVEAALSAHGFHFTDTVRTWFYLDRLLEWYDAFNAVRTAFFAERGVLAKLIPASTGIGAANSFRSALTCNVLAVQPRTAAVRLETVSSPLQISALSYRSSFSRAVELSFPSYRQLLVSGTASIDSEGRTAHAGDLAGQIALTMQVVEKLLRSRGMDWTDVTRGSAYFADLRQRALFEAYGAERALPPMPLALAQAAICRRELLFEIELDAARGGE